MSGTDQMTGTDQSCKCNSEAIAEITFCTLLQERTEYGLSHSFMMKKLANNPFLFRQRMIGYHHMVYYGGNYH